MKLGFVGLLALAIAAVAVPPTSAGDDPAHTTLTVNGMTCGGCVATVQLQLKRTAGVEKYEVSLERGEADVTYDASATTPEKIAASVSKTGFKAQVKPEKPARESCC